MFSLLSSWNPYHLFFPPPSEEPVKEDPHYQVLQRTEHGGLTSTECVLEVDNAGDYFLRPLSVKVSDPEQLPSSEGWPASIENETEYLRAINDFVGMTTTRPSTCVSELLSDLALNIPHDHLIVKDGKGNLHTLSGQVVSDIRRRSEFYINNTLVFRAKPLFPQPMPGVSDAENAKATFENCVCQLNNDHDLAQQALKLTTQATLAHQCALMHFYFSNPMLMWQMFCRNQVIKIDSNDKTTRITYESIWELANISETPGASKFMKADIQITVETDQLRRGIGREALLQERISPFLPTKQATLSTPLNKAGWLSLSSTRDRYQQIASKQQPITEPVPSMFVKKIVEDSQVSVSTIAFGSFNKLLSFHINNEDLMRMLPTGESLERRAALLIEKITPLLAGLPMTTNQIISFASKGLYKYLYTLFCDRYENTDLDYLLQMMNYKIDIERGVDTTTITVDSLWSLADDSSGSEKLNIYFKNKWISVMNAGDFSSTTIHTSPLFLRDYDAANKYNAETRTRL